MVIPSPGVMMPTMRSPGTAPPLGAKRTGRSVLIPRIGMAEPLSLPPGTLNFIALALARPNQPGSAFGAPAHALHDAPAELGILGTHRLTGGAAHRGPRLAGSDKRFPGGRRSDLGLGGENLDLVPVLQFGRQRRYLAVDLATDRVVADVGMHRIGEINRRGVARQGDQLAFGGKAEDLVLKKFELGVLKEFLRVGAFREQRDGAAQPRIGIRFPRQKLGRRARRVLIDRMGRYAVFGDVVHFLGADLQLDALVAGPDHGGMDRAVVVLLGG